MCWWRDWQPHQLEEVCVTLEQVRGGGAPHDDIVYLYYTHNQERKVISTQCGAYSTKHKQILKHILT